MSTERTGSRTSSSQLRWEGEGASNRIRQNQDVSTFISFDPTILKRHPHIADTTFVIHDDRIEFRGSRFSWQEGIEQIKRQTGLRSSRGRIFGFENQEGAFVLSLENPANLFYEHVEVEVPFDIGAIDVLPSREWYDIPESVQGQSGKVSVAPDASTQVVIKR